MVAVLLSPAEILTAPVLMVEMVAVKISGSGPSKTLSSTIVIFTAAEILPGGNVTLYGPGT